LAQATSLIASAGKHVTFLAQGEMGIGKSAMLKNLGPMFPNHKLCYVDLTTKDVGDFVVPKIRTIDGVEVCSFIPNEEFGIHHKEQPVLMMLDELGKAKGGVMNACLRLMYERSLGTYNLHPDSIVFATTNLAMEGIGDVVPPHARNRISTLRVAKPTAEAWMEWAVNSGVDPVIIATVQEYPEMLASFEDYEHAQQNPYIFHPQAQRSAFVTPRSLVTASHIYKGAKDLGTEVLCHTLAGTVGEAAMNNILTMVTLDQQLPSWAEIIADPHKTKVPTGAAGKCLLVMKAVQRVDAECFEAWMIYQNRMSKEAQGLFARSIMSNKCPKRKLATTVRPFILWATSNHFLFTD
jgi:hypothetical protein